MCVFGCEPVWSRGIQWRTAEKDKKKWPVSVQVGWIHAVCVVPCGLFGLRPEHHWCVCVYGGLPCANNVNPQWPP